MIVRDLLNTIGGNTNIVIRGTTDRDKWVDLWKGIGDDIKFPLVPYAKYEIEHISVSDNVLAIALDNSLNFAEMNPETVGMTAYINNQIITDLEKFEKFLKELNIEYDLSNNVIHINQNSIIEDNGSYGKDLEIKFTEDENFLGFEPWGE